MDALGILQEVSKRHGVDGRIADAMADAARLLGDGVDQMETRLLDSTRAAPIEVQRVSRHILEAGGKRIRPAICLLSYRAVGGEPPLPVELAVSCELLHNATLLHDDVIDEGDVRRGRPAARIAFGNAISILAGDYLLMRTVETVADHGPAFMREYVETLRLLVEGEVIQLGLRGSIETTAEQYFRIIEGKTASLFRWASYCGALAAEADEQACQWMARFGWHVGIAFQLIDDLLDLTADASRLGKSLLADIAQGKMTLPVILGSAREPKLAPLLMALVDGDEEPSRAAARIAEVVGGSGALDLVRKEASEHTDKALAALGAVPGENREVLDLLADLSRALLERDH
jgi:octaprenyl-diphosphate synthase